MAEDLDAIHLRACGCDEWHADQTDAEPVRSLMEHVVNPLLEQLGRATVEIEQYRIQLAAVTREPCTCDGDPVECSHEVARAAAEHELEALHASAVDGAR